MVHYTMLPIKRTCSECGKEYTKGCVIRLGEDRWCDNCNPYVFDDEDDGPLSETEMRSARGV